MTEYNLFCYSENFNNDKSFQQSRYRVFNTQVSKERYNEILHLVKTIIPNPNKLYLVDFWKSITNNQWLQLLSIPEAINFKEGFEYISGCEITTDIIGSNQTITIDSIDYIANIISKA